MQEETNGDPKTRSKREARVIVAESDHERVARIGIAGHVHRTA